MRLDYVLYGVAVLCFVIAGAFAVANIPGYELYNPQGIAVTMIFLLLGTISAAVGYSARPKAMMPVTQPPPPEAVPAVQEAPIIAPAMPPSEEMPSPSPPPPTETTAMPLEEPIAPTASASEGIASERPMPQAVEPTGPPVVESMEPEQTTVQEEPVKTAEPEKPKPTRRRRKKAH